MIAKVHSRIVDAMIELKERRDSGDAVHEILSEVAEYHRVSLKELKRRAETSWGTPLETDRERHAAHFRLVADTTDISTRARVLAKKVYEANLPGIREFSFWEVNWEQAIDGALERANLDNPALERVAREHFLNEAERLEKSIKLFRVQNASN